MKTFYFALALFLACSKVNCSVFFFIRDVVNKTKNEAYIFRDDERFRAEPQKVTPISRRLDQTISIVNHLTVTYLGVLWSPISKKLIIQRWHEVPMTKNDRILKEKLFETFSYNNPKYYTHRSGPKTVYFLNLVITKADIDVEIVDDVTL